MGKVMGLVKMYLSSVLVFGCNKIQKNVYMGEVFISENVWLKISTQLEFYIFSHFKLLIYVECACLCVL